MPRTLHRLTDARVKRVRKPGMYCDGGGLYLNVGTGADGAITKSWIFRFNDGRERQMGLGALAIVGLAEARQRAVQARKLRLDGIDPIEHRRRQRAAQREAEARVRTFQQVANEYLLRFEPSWKNWCHTVQWRVTLADYVYPVLGGMDVEKITTDDVLRVLLPIWGAKPETASRVRGRIESVLSFAGIDPNPARWRGHLEHRLAKRNRARDVKHLAALDWREMPAFMAELRNRDFDIAALALEFAVMTACRAGEVLGATWDEVDLQDRTWTIPKARMKRDREHRVPLSDDAVAVL